MEDPKSWSPANPEWRSFPMEYEHLWKKRTVYFIEPGARHNYFNLERLFNTMPKVVKPAWKTPELVILERSKPEEAVLLACKIKGNANSNANARFGNCQGRYKNKETGEVFCLDCQCNLPSGS